MIEEQMVEDVVLACRGLAESGMGDAIGGHVSMRVAGEDAYYCNAFDRAMAEVTADDVVKMSFDGQPLSAGAREVSIGLSFHSGIYQLRPDVNAIVHSHGHWITAQSAFARPPKVWHNLATFFEGDTAMSPDDTLEAIAPSLGDKSTIIIPWHGAITVAPTIARAAGLHHTLEYVARLDVTLSGTEATPMLPEMVQEMRDLVTGVGYLEQTWQLIRRQGRRALAREASYLARPALV